MKNKNTEKGAFKTALFFDFDDFYDILSQNNITVEYELDGLIFHVGENYCNNQDVCKILSNIFGLNVTSVHADDEECLGIWIIYKGE